MGSFGLKRYDEDDGIHYFSILSPTDLSVSENLELPFDKQDKDVDGGSCGDVVYFFNSKGKTVIFKIDTKECVVVPPRQILTTPVNCGEYRGNDDLYYAATWVPNVEYFSCGVSYDAKSGDYKVLRVYTETIWNQGDEHSSTSYCYDLYSVKSGSAKEITGPSPKCCMMMWQGTSTSTYVGEAGSGGGSCYWVAWSDDEDNNYSSYCPSDHVLAFDFATERFDQFPMPAWAKGGSRPTFDLVECRGSLGVLVHWFRPDEFSVEDRRCEDLSVRLFVWNVSGKGRPCWELLYDVTIADVERPIGLQYDGRVLFLAARSSDHGRQQQLVAYYLASKKVKKLDICDYRSSTCGFSFGDKIEKKKKKKKNKGKGKGKGK